jgi:hypothetical protein
MFKMGSKILDAVFLEDIVLLGERGLDGIGRRRDGRTCVAAGAVLQRLMQRVDHGEKDGVQRLLLVFHEDQVIDVRNADLRREARIDGAAARALAVHLLAGEFGVDQVLRLYAQALQVRAKHRRVQVHVEHARHADAKRLAFFDLRDALVDGSLCLPVPALGDGKRIGDNLRVA